MKDGTGHLQSVQVILINSLLIIKFDCTFFFFKAQKCDDPPIISNGEFVLSNNESLVGTTVEYSCVSRRFRLVGPKQIVCLPSGQYDSKPPYCKG